MGSKNKICQTLNLNLHGPEGKNDEMNHHFYHAGPIWLATKAEKLFFIDYYIEQS